MAWRLLPVLTGLPLGLVVETLACSAPMQTYSRPVGGGQFELVYHARSLASLAFKERSPDGVVTIDADALRFQARFPVSGLYRNVGESGSELLWEFDRPSYPNSYTAISDGIHLIKNPAFPPTLDSEGIAFYANGQRILSYPVSTFITNPYTVGSSSAGMTWAWPLGLDEETSTYTIETVERERFVFDYTTGEILPTPFYQIRRDTVVQGGLIATLIAAAAGFSGLILARRVTGEDA